MRGFQPERPVMWGLGSAGALLAFFIFLISLAITHRTPVYPQDDKALAAVHSDQCERPLDKSFMAEVQNTLSNVGYGLVGAFILLRVVSFPGHIFGANLVLLAFMSGYYHATLEHTPQELDVGFVYAALISAALYAAFVRVQAPLPYNFALAVWLVLGGIWGFSAVLLALIFNAKALLAFFAISLLVAGMEALCYLCRQLVPALGLPVFLFFLIGIPPLSYLARDKFGWDSDAVFAILAIVLLLQMTLIITNNLPVHFWLLAGEIALLVGLFGLGLFARLGDGYETGASVTRKFLCHPDGLLQAHGQWHLISAAALLILYDVLAQFSHNQPETSDRTVLLPEGQIYL